MDKFCGHETGREGSGEWEGGKGERRVRSGEKILKGQSQKIFYPYIYFLSVRNKVLIH